MPKLDEQTKPAINEFEDFAEQYFSRCKKGFGDLETLTAKWTFEDLIPGLSDFDGRLVVSNRVGPAEMVELDEIVGRTHAGLCREHPRWYRILEHTPGIAVTWEELFDPRLYNTETRTWTAYQGDVDKFRQYESYLSSLAWQKEDEHYFLKKFSYYFSPYQRGIDPPINLGIFEPEYSWHSRAMHYFTPAVQAAVSVIKKRAIRGKLETLRLWKEILPAETVFDRIIEMSANQYTLSRGSDDDALRQFEDELFLVLRRIKELLIESATIVDVEPGVDMEKVREQLDRFPANPLIAMFNGIRFSRIRKSRYIFYLEAPEHFASESLLENELIKWNREVLVKAVLAAYGELKCGKSDAQLEEIIEAICPELIDRRQVGILRKMHEISCASYIAGEQYDLVRKIIPLWPEYYFILETILHDAKRRYCQKLNERLKKKRRENSPRHGVASTGVTYNGNEARIWKIGYVPGLR